MNDSLAEPVSAFDNVKWSQVITLLDVLRDHDLGDAWHVERRYREFALGYPQTLAFVRAIGLVRHDGRKVIRTGANAMEADRTGDVLAQLVAIDTPYRDEVFRYLRTFEIIDGELVRRADIIARLRESPCRNFLMDLGIVRHRPESDDYVLDPAYVSMYAASREAAKGVSPARIQALNDKRKAIGDVAERAVVAWEQERLGPAHANRVKHIAPRNEFAGYDVLSATVAAGLIQPRYIEVKAVSRRSFQFFWSENEVNVASVLGRRYYLYLVPMNATGTPVASDTRMICDPYVAVLSGADWEVEANVRSCRPAGGSIEQVS
jgi:hypothetical protein